MNKFILAICLLIFAVNESVAQCCPDRHSTNAHDGWISCTPSQNPVAGEGNGHWIHYDFGQIHEMHQSTFWNINDPDRLTDNARHVRIHYSLNGQSWIHWGNMNFVQATGDPKYEGFEGPNFNGIQARYLVLTAVTNFGGSCVGFAEMRINTEPATAQQFQLAVNPCINEGVIYGIEGGIFKDGTFSGTGVINSYEDKFDFDPDQAGPGLHTISYQYIENGNLVTHTASISVGDCGTGTCGPCPPCDDVFQPILDGDPILNGTYYDAPELNSVGTVQSAYNIDLRGSESVNLNEGFEVKGNAVFEAQIRKCESALVNNLLFNGDFESGSMSPWVMEIHDPAVASMSLETNPVHVASGNASAKVVTTSTTDTEWHIQFKQFGPTFVEGQPYLLTFSAKANVAVDIGVGISREISPWNTYGYNSIGLTTQWQQFTMAVVPDEDNNGFVRVSARLSDIPAGTFWFDDFVLTAQ